MKSEGQRMAGQGTKQTAAKKNEALEALEAEATGSTVTVTFRKEKVTVDPEVLDDYEIVDMLSKGIPTLALEALVTDSEQRERLLETCEKSKRGAPKLSAVVEMVSELMGAVGAGK